MPSEDIKLMEMSLRAIKVDTDLQSRVRTNMEVVQEYADEIMRKGIFPPVDVFFDGNDYWLTDGFHRYEAHIKAGQDSIRANVRPGTKHDALLFSVSANIKNPLRLTRDDRRKAVEMLLADSEYRKFSDAEIGRRCGVSGVHVGRLRQAFNERHAIADESVRLQVRGGRKIAVQKPQTGVSRYWVDKKGYAYLCRNDNTKKYLGKDSDEAKRKFEETVAEELAARQSGETVRISLKVNDNVRSWLKRRGIETTVAERGPAGWPDMLISGAVIRLEDQLTPRTLPVAVGDVLLWRQGLDPALRAIVLGYHEDLEVQALDVARSLDIEFLTPQELVIEHMRNRSDDTDRKRA